jgi:adenylate cyclase class 2
MAGEIEVKVLEIDTRDVERRLRAMGARKVFSGKVVTVMYDFPDRRLRDSDVVVRLRSMGGKYILGAKTGLTYSRVKSAHEHELVVDDPECLENILAAIGLEPRRRFVKHRIAYALGSCHVDIDKLPGIPTYLEIEAPNQRKLFPFLERLGFSRKDAKPWGTGQLLKHYGREDYGKI